jgi:hypothetical protein
MQRPDTIWIICHENPRHRYEASSHAIELLCPHCGCRYGRMDEGESVHATVTIDTSKPYAHPNDDSWVAKLPDTDEHRTPEKEKVEKE